MSGQGEKDSSKPESKISGPTPAGTSSLGGIWVSTLHIPPNLQSLDVPGLLARGSLLSEQDKHEDAVMVFELAAVQASSLLEKESRSDKGPTGKRSAELCSQVAKALLGKGIALGRLGRSQSASAAFEGALLADPCHTEALSYLGLLRVKEDRIEEGISQYRKALAIDSNCRLAMEGLATVLTDEGTRFKLAGQTDEGFRKYEEAAKISPQYAPCHYNIGIVLAERGRNEEALEAYQTALSVCPTYTEAYNNIGVLLKSMGRLPESINAYKKCLRSNPNFQLANLNLALALSDYGTMVKAEGRLTEAIEVYQQALFYDPKSSDVMYNLGVAYAENCEHEKACVLYELTTHFNTRCAEAWNNLGVIHKDFDNLQKAMSCYEAALRIRPTFPEALNNMGVVFTMMCMPEDAISYFNAALQVQPSYSEAYTNLGKFFQDSGDAEKAIELYEKCLVLNPYCENAAHNRLLALNYSITRPHSDISMAHEVWGKDFARQAEALRSKYPKDFPNSKIVGRKLRIGYISPDFNTHSVAYFAEVALKDRNREHSHVVCYCASRKEDSSTTRLRLLSDEWRVVFGIKPQEVANMVRKDEIDILVELAGHTAANRLDVMALSPAPVQVTWIGYPNTTGLKEIHYRITDANADPVDTTQRYCEELVRMPEAFLCYTPPPDAGPVLPSPCVAAGHVTFGSFNNVAKVNANVVRLWSRILAAVPESRIIFKSRAFAAKEVRESCMQAFAMGGIERSRLDLSMVVPSTTGHLHAYGRMDISLDTFPYAGTTTTCEALYMGVPVVTLRATGKDATHAQNVGVSLLMQAGLQELIADDMDDYFRKAVDLALDTERIVRLRSVLREQLQQSPLCQGERFMRNLEAEYAKMWHRYCSGEQPSTNREEGNRMAAGAPETCEEDDKEETTNLVISNENGATSPANSGTSTTTGNKAEARDHEKLRKQLPLVRA